MNDVFSNHVAAAFFLFGEFEHDIQHDAFDNRTKSPRAGILRSRPVGDCVQGAVGEFEFAVFQLEQPLELFNQCIARFAEHTHQVLRTERRQRRQHGQPADEFGNQSEFENVVFGQLREQLAEIVLVRCITGELTKADRFLTEAFADDLFDADEWCHHR